MYTPKSEGELWIADYIHAVLLSQHGRVLYRVDKVVISMAEIQLNLFTESIGCNVNVVKLIAVLEKG